MSLQRLIFSRLTISDSPYIHHTGKNDNEKKKSMLEGLWKDKNINGIAPSVLEKNLELRNLLNHIFWSGDTTPEYNLKEVKDTKNGLYIYQNIQNSTLVTGKTGLSHFSMIRGMAK